jgi:hypothetical protein
MEPNSVFNSKYFNLRYFGGIMLLNVLVGIGAYFVAYQFNDGKINITAIGSIFLAMALPNLLIGGVTRLFRMRIGKYFLRMALLWIAVGLVLIFQS